MKKLFITILIMLTTFSCGFKVVNQSNLIDFSISEIKTTGDKRINYKLKNKLFFMLADNGKRLITLNLDTQKNKNVKERNIKNEITKYQIIITVNIKLEDDVSKNMKPFTITENGDYIVATQHSQTLNNEKRLIELLSDRLAEKILEELLNIMNDI